MGSIHISVVNKKLTKKDILWSVKAIINYCTFTTEKKVITKVWFNKLKKRVKQ